MIELKEVGERLEKIRKKRPLIHNLTNTVVTNFTANGLLALGASPVMADSEEEAADMAKVADGVLLNLGTIYPRIVNAMVEAGKSANRRGIPVVMDPVGLGATPYRLQVFKEILQQVRVDILRGNAAEMANAVGEVLAIKGVDAEEISMEEKVRIAERVARELGTVAVVTGREDVASNGIETYVIDNGHPLLTRVTGTGCLLGSVIAAFAAVEEDLLKAAVSALVVYGVAAERAVEEIGEERPGRFQIAFLDRLALLSEVEVLTYGKVARL